MKLSNADPGIENFQFLLLDLQQQLNRGSRFILANDTHAAITLVDHNDYLNNIATIVKNHCINGIAENKDHKSRLILRNIYDIANVASNISNAMVDFLRYCNQEILLYLEDDKPTKQLLKLIINAINKVETLIVAKKPDLGLRLSDMTEEIQEDINDYVIHINIYCDQVKDIYSKSAFFYLISMFNTIEKNLVALSEAVLSIEQSKVVSIRQFHALKATLKKIGGDEFAEDASFNRIGETKSGCSIVGVSADKTSNEYMAIFKEGKKAKIKGEKKKFESWNKVFPGVAPQVFSYQKNGRSAGILVEYLKGKTFEQLLLSKNQTALDIALDKLCHTLEKIWETTLDLNKQEKADYIGQLKKRLPAILTVHPEFNEQDIQLRNLEIAGLNKLLEKCELIEENFTKPFCIFAHGDFNIDNIIFDSESGNPRFIDLHRSRDMDYLQDVSVFIISNYRTKVIDPDIRLLIGHVIIKFYHWIEAFAKKHKDETFEIRMCLALARSYITSTRFTLDEKHANNMFMRGRYLLEKLAYSDNEQLKNFKLPKRVLYD